MRREETQHDLMTSDEVARELRVTEGTLANWRVSGKHNLPFSRIGRRITYRRADVADFITSRTRRSTTGE